jgi:alpha-D-ribose 1-methylphosphonate 5-triphosphate synthase subunit PhnH
LIVTPFASGAPSDSAVASITFRGPGVAESTSIGYAANIDEVERLGSILSTRRSAPPCGFDMWLFDPHGRVVGVPRTSHVDFHAEITVKGES